MMYSKYIISVLHTKYILLFITYVQHSIDDDPVVTAIRETTYCEMPIRSDSSGCINIDAVYYYASSYVYITSHPVMFHTGHNIIICVTIIGMYAFKFTVQAPQLFVAFSPTNVSVMLNWSPPVVTNAMEQNIRLERYELK